MAYTTRKIGSSAISDLLGTAATVTSAAAAWANVNNALADDANYSTVSLSGASTDSEFLRITNATFVPNVPDSVRATSVSFTVNVKTTNEAKDLSVLLWDGSATLGTDQALAANYSTSDAEREYTFDVQGLGLTAETIKSSGFGLVFASQWVSGITAVVSVKLVEKATVEWTMRKNRTG